MPSRPVSRRPHVLGFSLARFTSAIAIVAALAGHSAQAGTNKQVGPNTSWSDPLSWSLGTVPGAGDALLFDTSSLLNTTLDNSYTSQTLSFDTGANSLTIDANAVASGAQTLTLSGGTNALGGSELIATSATTTGTIAFGSTPFVGTIGVALTTDSIINVANAAATVNFDVNSVISGAFSLNKTGAGTLTLAGTNTFGAAGKNFTLTSGQVNLNSAAALGTSTSALVINGGTVDNTSFGALTLTGNHLVTLGGNFTFAGTQSLNLGTGNVTLTGSRTITVTNNTLTLGGAISGATFGVTKAGNGTLALNGVIGTTTGGLAVNGGTLVIGGTANTFTGNITVDGATSVLQVNTPGNGNATSSPLGIFTGGTGYKTVTLTNGGTFRPMATYNVNTPTAALPGNGQVFIFGAGGGVLDIPSGATMTLDDGSGNGTATTNADIQGTGNLTKTGLGALSMGNGTSNFSTFTGQIFVNQGTLITSSGTNQLGDTVAGTTIASGAVLDVRNALSAEPISVVGSGISNGGALITSTGTGTVPGPVTFGGDTTIGGAGALNLTGTLTGSGTLTKVGAGNTTISGANAATLSGPAILSAGVLTISNPGTTNVIDNLGTGAVTLNAGSFQLKANASGSFQNITFANPITVAGTATIDVNRVSGTNTNSSISINTLNLTGGQLNVTGANTYHLNVTGTTTISGATTINPTTEPINLLGKVNDGGLGLTVSGTNLTRLMNAGTGASANSISGVINVNGGNLQGFAPAADAAVATANTLGTATIALSGTNPTLRLTPNLAGGLNTAPVAGLNDKSYTGTTLTSLALTNFMGATQPVTTGAGGQNPTGNQTVTTVNIPSAVTATTTSHQYTGLINITTPGVYTFQAFSDDGGNFSIDGSPAIVTANTTVTGAIYLTAGYHILSDRWNNNGGNGGDVLSYQGPDSPTMSVIPAGVLSQATMAQLATTFSNNITFAAGSNSSIEVGGNTTIGTLSMVGTGTGTALNLTGLGDVTTLNVPSLTITDAVTINNPTVNVLVGAPLNVVGSTAIPFTKSGMGTLSLKGAFAPTGLLTLNAGTLSLANDGAGSNGTIAQGNNVVTTGQSVVLDLRSNGGSTNNLVAFGSLSTPSTATVTSTTFSGGDGYRASFTSLALTGTTGGNTTLIADIPVTITGNVTNQMTGFGTGNFDTLFLSGASTGSSIQGSIGEAGTFTPLTGGYTRLIKTGTGTWTISGANTYTGITQVQAGTLKAGASNIFSSLNLQGIDVTATGAGTTATFDFGNTTQTLNTVNSAGNALNLGGSTATSAPRIIGAGGTAIITGNVNYNATNNPVGGVISVSNIDLNAGNRTFAVGLSTSAGTVANPDLDVSSNLSNGTLTKTGTGVLRLTGNLNLTNLFDTAGTIAITAATTLNNTVVGGSGSTFDLGGTTQNVSNFALFGGNLVNGALTGTNYLKQGPGVLNLGVPTTVTSVTVNQGLLPITSNPSSYSTMNLNFAAAGVPTTNIVTGTATLTLGGSPTNLLGGGALTATGAASVANSQSFSSTLFDAGSDAVGATIGTGGSVAINLGTISRNVGATVDFTLPAGTQSATNGITVANPGTAGTLVTSTLGTAYATVGGSDWAAYSTDVPGNIVAASAAGAGGTSILTTSNSAGTFSGNANITGSFTATSGSTVNSIRFNTGALTLTLAGTNTITSGGILFGSGISGVSSITGGTIVPGAGQELTIYSDKANTLNTINTAIADGASGPTTVVYRSNDNNGTTAGIIDIKVNGTYTGPTYITSGRVATQSSAITQPFGTGPNAIVYVDGNADGQFFTNQNTTIANPFVIIGTGLNENGTRTGALRIQSQASGQNPTLSGPVTLLGDTTIGNTTLVANGYGVISGNIGTSTSAGATSFTLTKTGAGGIRLSGTNSQTNTVLAAGPLNITSDAALGVTSAPVTFGGGSLQLNSAMALPATRSLVLPAGVTGVVDTSLTAVGAVSTISGVISGPGAFNKSYSVQGLNTNPLILSGVNTFTGNVTATSGWLVATNSSSFGVGAKTITANTNTSSDSIHLDAGAGGTIDFPANFSFQTSNDTFTNANEGTITNDSGNNIIRGNITMTSGGGGTIVASKAGSLTLTGNFTPNTTGRALKFRGDGTGVVSGVIANGTTVDMPVTRDLGAGTWTFSGANTYTGSTTVNAGTLKLGNAAALGGLNTGVPTADNGTFVTAGGTLDLGGQGVNEVIRIAGTGNGNAGALINTGSAVTIGGSLASLKSAGTTGITISGTTSVSLTGGGGTGATATASLGVSAASFAITGGTTVYSAAPTVTIAGGTGATATAVLTSGVVSGITITNPGSGFSATVPTITFSGGTVTTAGTNPTGTGNNTNFVLNSVSITNAGTGYTSPVTATLVNTSGANTALTVGLGGVTLTGNSSIGGSGDITVTTPVTESGGSFGVTKVGNNILTFAGTNTYTGATAVQSGSVIVTGSLTGAVNVTDNGLAGGASGVLGGTGTVGNVAVSATTAGTTAGGIVNPGLPGLAGVLNVGTGTGTGFDLGLGSTLSIDFGGTGAGQYDRLSVASGSGINLAGNLTGSFLSGFQPADGSLFFIAVNNGSAVTSGAFANQFDMGGGYNGVTIGSQLFLVSYNANFLGDGNVGNAFTGGNDVALQAIPEPTAAISLLGGLGLLLTARRRRKA